MVTLLPDPLVNGSGTDKFFDKSMVTGCGVKWTGGRDMTTSEGVGDSELGLISSAMEKRGEISFENHF